MANEAKITLCDGYVLAQPTGDAYTASQIQKMLAEAAKQAIEHDVPIVVHREIAVQPRASTLDCIDCGEFLRKSGFANKIAIVFPEEMHGEILRLFATAATNRGVDLRLFTAMDKALKWIGLQPEHN